MAQSAEPIRRALADLLATHTTDDVIDPTKVRELLDARLAENGNDPAADPALLDAVVAATNTPVLRGLGEHASARATSTQLSTALRKTGLAEPLAAAAAEVWANSLFPESDVPSGEPAMLTPSAPIPPSAPPPLPSPVPPAPLSVAPAPATPAPAPDAPQPGAPPTEPAVVFTAPVRPPSPRPTPPSPRPVPPVPPMPVAAAAATAPGARVGERNGASWPRTAKLVAGVLAVLALGAGAVAAVGWLRDPSKARATTAESELTQRADELASTQKQLNAAQADLTDKNAKLASATDQINKMSTLTRAQYNSARFPDAFTMNGKVAPGSCSLAGDACNATPIVRAITLACDKQPCDCTVVKCTVTSELWRSAAPVTYDPATALFSARGQLDGDVFRCAGVPQATNFEFRFRVSKVSYVENTWKATGVDAELAESSTATDQCLSGNRTYSLSGPAN